MKTKLIISILLLLNIVLIYRQIFLFNKNEVLDNLPPIKASLFYSYQINGKKIPKLNLINLKSESIDFCRTIAKRRIIVLIYSDITCNSCIDSLLVGCNSLVNLKKGEIKIFGIMQTNNSEYILRFSRINNIKFPLFWDKEKKMTKELNISSLPVILMVDEDSKIINSYFINPKNNKLNSVFFDAAKSFATN